jgi:L-amino acid N-acyltransferase YncA
LFDGRELGDREMELRDAERKDVPGILSIFNEVIVNSTAVYFLAPVELGEREAWFDNRRAAGYPVIVAIDGNDVVGFASFGAWRTAPAYAWTVEHTVHVRAGSRGRGIGSALVSELFGVARAMGKHVMIGGIDAENTRSLAFHRRLGFEPVAHFRSVGRKFDRWLDLLFVQRQL